MRVLMMGLPLYVMELQLLKNTLQLIKICREEIIKFAIMPNQMKVLCDFRDNYEKMSIDLGLDLQECEMDTFKNYRGRWSKNG